MSINPYIKKSIAIIVLLSPLWITIATCAYVNGFVSTMIITILSFAIVLCIIVTMIAGFKLAEWAGLM